MSRLLDLVNGKSSNSKEGESSTAAAANPTQNGMAASGGESSGQAAQEASEIRPNLVSDMIKTLDKQPMPIHPTKKPEAKERDYANQPHSSSNSPAQLNGGMADVRADIENEQNERRDRSDGAKDTNDLFMWAEDNHIKDETLSALISMGFDVIDAVALLRRSDIDSINVSLGQKRLLENAVRKLRILSGIDQSLKDGGGGAFYDGPGGGNVRITITLPSSAIEGYFDDSSQERPPQAAQPIAAQPDPPAQEEDNVVPVDTLSLGGASLAPSEREKVSWKAFVTSSDFLEAGTWANVYIQIYGSEGITGEIYMGKKFGRKSTVEVPFEIVDIGMPYKLRVWHDNVGYGPGWHLHKIEIETHQSQLYEFICDRWLADDEDDKEVVREIPAKGPGIDNSLPLLRYQIFIYTGTEKYAGTDAKVFICIYGSQGDTGQRFLNWSSTHKKKFQEGQEVPLTEDEEEEEPQPEVQSQPQPTGGRRPRVFERFYSRVSVVPDNLPSLPRGSSKRRSQRTRMNVQYCDVFQLEAVFLGKIESIWIGHDGSNPGAGWYLEKVKIFCHNNPDYYADFECKQWLYSEEDLEYYSAHFNAVKSGMSKKLLLA